MYFTTADVVALIESIATVSEAVAEQEAMDALRTVCAAADLVVGTAIICFMRIQIGTEITGRTMHL